MSEAITQIRLAALALCLVGLRRRCRARPGTPTASSSIRPTSG